MTLTTKLRPKPIPPDGGWGWVVVFCSFVNQFLCVGTALSLGVMYVFWLEDFQENKSVTSWILSLLYFTMCVIGPLPASMAEKWGFKVVTVIGGFVMSLGLAVSYFATSVGFLIFSIGCLTGCGMAFIYLSTLATVALYFDKRRTLANGIGTSGAGFGCFIMPLLLEKFEELYGWRGAMLVLSAITLHVCAAGLLLRSLEDNECMYLSGDQLPDVYLTEYNAKGGVDNVTDNDNISDRMALPEKVKGHVQDKEALDKNLKEHSMSEPHGVYEVHDLRVLDGDESGGSEYLIKGSHDEKLPPPVYHVVTQIRDTSKGISKFGSAPLEITSKHGNHFTSVDDVRLRALKSQVMTLSCDDHRLNCSTNGVSPKSLQSLDPHVLGSMPSLLKRTYSATATYGDCISTSSSISSKKKKGGTFTNSTLFQNIQAYMELLGDKKFMLFACCNILINWTLTLVLVYVADRAVAEGLGTSAGALIVAFNGVGNVIGRVFFGIVADRFFKDHVTCFVLILSIMGVATLLSPLCGKYVELHCLYTTIFGATLGGNVVLMVSVTVALMGLEKATLALGLNLVAIGVGDLIGPPVGGFLYDVTQSYLYSFLLAGVLAIMSAVLLLPLRKK